MPAPLRAAVAPLSSAGPLLFRYMRGRVDGNQFAIDKFATCAALASGPESPAGRRRTECEVNWTASIVVYVTWAISVTYTTAYW
jgi:hypothetical protein